MNSTPTLSPAIRQIAENAEKDMDVVYLFGPGYDNARQVYNRRIQNLPLIIAYCQTPEHVSYWFEKLKEHNVPIVVRAGGHHHEGMCTESLSVVIDVSRMNHCDVSSDKSRLSVGPGKKLGELIEHITGEGRVLPTGGCKTVCVGGLTHGGGWGASYRYLGLTVDKLCEVEIVLPTGDIIRLNKKGIIGEDINPKYYDHYPRLFWAIRGGGGGNFGVVTNFIFELTKPPKTITQFAIQWSRKHMIDIMTEWVCLQDSSDKKLTSALRLTVVGEESTDNPVVLLGGLYYGDKAECRLALSKLYEKADPMDEKYFPIDFEDSEKATKAMASPFAMEGAFGLNASGQPRPAQSYSLQVGARSRTQKLSNCEYEDCPEPHKVSSAFPISPDHDKSIIYAIKNSIEESKERPHANIYMSLHGLGGQGACEPEEQTAYPWRNKHYMLQIQAWWLDKEDSTQFYLDWVKAFRDELSNYTEGAFINFPDKDITKDIYYDASYPELQTLKGIFDEDNIMRFGMSIDPN